VAIDTSFTSEGDAFRANMRRFFAELSPLESQRISSGPVAGLPSFWGQFAELDLLSIGIHSDDLASTTELVDVFPLYLEMGRTLAMSPHLASSMIALPTIVALDSEHHHAELVEGLSRGDVVVVPALSEIEVNGPLADFETRADRTKDGWKIFGEKIFVQYAHVASHILVPAHTDGGQTAFVVPSGDAVVTYMENASQLPIFHVTFDGVDVSDAQRVGAIGAALPVFQTIVDRAVVLRAVELVGAGERILEFCLDYAKVRKQFGTAIGTFQAVQYLCTDIAISTRVTFLLALQCASKMHNGEAYAHELAALRKYAKRASSMIVGRAQEVHAGVAFMDEFDLHLFTRRSLFWQSEFGDDDSINADLTDVRG
jgi:alkylation response protein AidB-like acyl-CoA dehydrogenase